jgi:voltage-gated potassium channel
MEEIRLRGIAALLGHTTVVLVLLTAGYYLFPVRFDEATDRYLRLPGSLLSLGVLGVVLRRQARRSRRALSAAHLRVQWLLSALYFLVLGFALLYAAIAATSPTQFTGIEDRTDALYFSVTLVATVGFGDIHPTGTAGQLAATVHMLFNLIYLGTALRLLSARPDLRGGPGSPG